MFQKTTKPVAKKAVKKSVKKDLASLYDTKTGVDVGKGKKVIPKIPMGKMPMKGSKKPC